MPEMDYAHLKERIKDCGLTQKDCADLLEISESQFNRKLAGEYVFRQDEINGLCEIPGIDGTETGKYFFGQLPVPLINAIPHLSCFNLSLHQPAFFQFLQVL